MNCVFSIRCLCEATCGGGGGGRCTTKTTFWSSMWSCTSSPVLISTVLVLYITLIWFGYLRPVWEMQRRAELFSPHRSSIYQSSYNHLHPDCLPLTSRFVFSRPLLFHPSTQSFAPFFVAPSFHLYWVYVVQVEVRRGLTTHAQLLRVQGDRICSDRKQKSLHSKAWLALKQPWALLIQILQQNHEN